MPTSFRNIAKRIPGLKSLVVEIRNTFKYLRLRPLLRSLYPISTDKTLIRFGPCGDGGYLIPDDLDGIQACFSPGVSSISGFEMDCAKRGIKVFLADRSVDRPSEQHELFHFSKVFIGSKTKDGFLSLDDWVTNSVNDECCELIMQMDIEGSEYEVINYADNTTLERFRIFVAEFHGLDSLDKNKIMAFEKLLRTHTCIHIHPNNCCGSIQLRNLVVPRVMEFTFLRNDRITNSEFQSVFPHPLDFDNITQNPPMVLPACWYKG